MVLSFRSKDLLNSILDYGLYNSSNQIIFDICKVPEPPEYITQLHGDGPDGQMVWEMVS